MADWTSWYITWKLYRHICKGTEIAMKILQRFAAECLFIKFLCLQEHVRLFTTSWKKACEIDKEYLSENLTINFKLLSNYDFWFFVFDNSIEFN